MLAVIQRHFILAAGSLQLPLSQRQKLEGSAAGLSGSYSLTTHYCLKIISAQPIPAEVSSSFSILPNNPHS